MKYLNIILLIILFQCPLFSQQKGYRLFTTSDGLPHNSVCCILQDKHNFMWFGTNNGLCRFNGNNFTVFKRKNSANSLSGNFINCLSEDKEGKLWIGTVGEGVSYYNPYHNTFKNIFYSVKRGWGNFDINDIAHDSVYTYAMSMGNELYRIKKERVFKTELSNGSGGNNHFFRNSNGELFIITHSLQIFKVEDKDLLKINHQLKYKSTLNAICQETPERIWLGLENGTIIILNTNNFKEIKKVEKFTNHIKFLFKEKGKNNILLSVRGKGLYNLNWKDDVVQKSNLNSKFIESIFVDKQNNLWVGSWEGLWLKQKLSDLFNYYPYDQYSTSGQTIVRIKGYVNENIIPFDVSDDRINFFDREKKDFFTPGQQCFYRGKYLLFDQNNRYWIEKNNQIHINDQYFNTLRIVSIPEKVKIIKGIFEYNINTYYFLTDNCLWKYNFENNSFTRIDHLSFWPDMKDNESVYSINHVIKDRKNNLWVGTSTGGLYKINPDGDLKQYHLDRYFNGPKDTTKIYHFHSNIRYLLLTSENELLVFSNYGTIFKYNTEKDNFQQINQPEDVHNNNTFFFSEVSDVLEDRSNNLWLQCYDHIFYWNRENNYVVQTGVTGTLDAIKHNAKYFLFPNNGGLSIINRSKIMNKPKQKELYFLNLTSDDGLPIDIFTSNSLLLEDNTLISVVKDGIITVQYDSLCHFLDKKQSIPIYVTSVTCNNDKVNTDSSIIFKKNISLPHNINNLTIEYSALSFNEHINYKYRLKGIEDEWIEAGSRNFIAFNGLKPGHYTFEVTAKNATTKSLKINIKPAWWQTLSFQVSAAVLLVVIFIIFIRIREANLKKSKQILEEKVQERTKLLQNKKEKIELQQKELKENIYYAEKIQQSILPQQEEIKESFSDCFILFKPRDIVSGDFYFFRKINNKIIIAVADCTGHGVSAAILSILGSSFLNETISLQKKSSTNAILNTLRDKIKKSLHQSGKDHETKDGMEISLCIIDAETNMLEFSGSYLPLYLIRNNKLNIYKGDRQPIAVYLKEKEFTSQRVELKKNDILYLLSDGYASQIGGNEKIKFMTPNLKKLLKSIHQKPMKEQKQILINNLEDWQGEYDQVDDITVIGLKW